MGSKQKPKIRTKEECQKIIEAIRIFKKTVDPIDDRASNKLAFLLGEYAVLKRVLEIYPDAEHWGGQSHCDITIPDPHIDIEVKTSTFKNDNRVYKGLEHWGWTVETEIQWKRRKKTGAKRFNYVIAVALHNQSWDPELFIIPWNDAIEVNKERPIKGLSNIRLRINLFKDDNDLLEAHRRSQGTDPYLGPTILEELLVKNPQQFQNWDIL